LAATVTTGRGTAGSSKQAEHGFTLIEVMISMAVLTIGLVSLLAVFGLAMAATQTSQEDMIAKQLANEALESIVTARNTSQLQWDQVQNVGSGSGIFVTGLQPINLPGADGIVGTGDDALAGAQTLTEPGPDGIYGTADDVQLPLSNYQRQVTISDVQDASGNLVTSLRAINVTIQYTTPRLATAKTYVLSSYISQYR
jgi:prepilin-type N-terminal cleavage/methylation domain-containing protein